MHTSQDYTIFQFIDEKHDRFPMGNNWINANFLLGPVYLGLIQLMNSIKIKNSDQEQINIAVLKQVCYLFFFFCLNELPNILASLFCKYSYGALKSCSKKNFHAQGEHDHRQQEKNESAETINQFGGNQSSTQKRFPQCQISPI